MAPWGLKLARGRHREFIRDLHVAHKPLKWLKPSWLFFPWHLQSYPQSLLSGQISAGSADEIS